MIIHQSIAYLSLSHQQKRKHNKKKKTESNYFVLNHITKQTFIIISKILVKRS